VRDDIRTMRVTPCVEMVKDIWAAIYYHPPAMGGPEMKCRKCGHEMAEQRVTYLLQTKAGPVVIEQVPALVCVQCGSRLFPIDVTERLGDTTAEAERGTLSTDSINLPHLVYS
jgi:YgiT-type zinc finger domain-containing protein